MVAWDALRLPEYTLTHCDYIKNGAKSPHQKLASQFTEEAEAMILGSSDIPYGVLARFTASEFAWWTTPAIDFLCRITMEKMDSSQKVIDFADPTNEVQLLEALHECYAAGLSSQNLAIRGLDSVNRALQHTALSVISIGGFRDPEFIPLLRKQLVFRDAEYSKAVLELMVADDQEVNPAELRATIKELATQLEYVACKGAEAGDMQIVFCMGIRHWLEKCSSYERELKIAIALNLRQLLLSLLGLAGSTIVCDVRLEAMLTVETICQKCPERAACHVGKIVSTICEGYLRVPELQEFVKPGVKSVLSTLLDSVEDKSEVISYLEAIRPIESLQDICDHVLTK